jgi:hypothetical protein
VFFDVDVRDGTGAVCTTCEGLWISMTPMKLAAAAQSAPSKL